MYGLNEIRAMNAKNAIEELNERTEDLALKDYLIRENNMAARKRRIEKDIQESRKRLGMDDW